MSGCIRSRTQDMGQCANSCDIRSLEFERRFESESFEVGRHSGEL